MKYAPSRLRILAVDPSTQFRQLLRTMFLSEGVDTIYGTNNAKDGFEAFCDNYFNVVFVEFDMAPMSGLELTDLIRMSPKSPNPFVPIIMLTARSYEERVKRARDHGVTEFIAKPFSFSVVIEHLRAIFENPRPFVRTTTYFGPDRRRISAPSYSGPERRKNSLSQVFLKRDNLTAQQHKALARNKQAPVE